MKLRERLGQERLILDGGMGTLLQTRGLRPGELPERWNLTHAQEIIAVHQAYFDAGSSIVSANTFGANPLKYGSDELRAIVCAAMKNVRTAAALSASAQEKYAALSIGPTGKLLRPYGDLAFEDAVAAFAAVVRLGAEFGADLILIETMNDSYETKAAVLAAKENCDLPILVSNVYGEDGKLMTGASPAAMVAMLEGLGVDAIGANCSLGPQQLAPVMEELLRCASVPVLFKPNAGIPVCRDGRTVFSVEADAFAAQMRQAAQAGASLLGGCCGTTPEYIARLTAAVRDIAQPVVTEKDITLVSSYTHAVAFSDRPVLIGERINPTGKKRFQQALRENDIDYILKEGLAQQEAGAQILDVNVGLPGLDEAGMLERCVYELQSVTDLPLQLDTADADALERALRLYNGKAMVNSVSGKRESMEKVFPLVKKYGGLVVALTLDEDGIPETADGRAAIAEKILAAAQQYGIAKKNIIFDTLCMSVSADPAAAQTTVTALCTIRERLQALTVLGVSNISFGLPQREWVNAAFLSMALENGLNAAIVNPYCAEIQRVCRTFRLLHGKDAACASYIDFAQAAAASAPAAAAPQETAGGLQEAIVKGLKERSALLCEALLQSTPPMELVDRQIIPALDTVGRGFEEKRVYLPQLLMSAEAAKEAFEKVRSAVLSAGMVQEKRAGIVLATVKGDIHDIGKNIVRVLLENYGYAVTDLGRDVAPEDIVAAVQREQAQFCGLSALMTTTVPAMEETIRQLRVRAPKCKIVVGGAVLTAEYAEKIGADRYARDAMSTVRYLEEQS